MDAEGSNLLKSPNESFLPSRRVHCEQVRADVALPPGRSWDERRMWA